jgi:hypothetical protein
MPRSRRPANLGCPAMTLLEQRGALAFAVLPRLTSAHGLRDRILQGVRSGACCLHLLSAARWPKEAGRSQSRRAAPQPTHHRCPRLAFSSHSN